MASLIIVLLHNDFLGPWEYSNAYNNILFFMSKHWWENQSLVKNIHSDKTEVSPLWPTHMAISMMVKIMGKYVENNLGKFFLEKNSTENF